LETASKKREKKIEMAAWKNQVRGKIVLRITNHRHALKTSGNINTVEEHEERRRRRYYSCIGRKISDEKGE